MPLWNQIYLQDSWGLTNYLIGSFHDTVMMVVIFIVSMILSLVVGVGILGGVNRYFFKSEFLEIVWTVVPGLVVGVLGVPSLLTLYLMEEGIVPQLTLKAIGHQWYWSYEYSDFKTIEFESYLSPMKKQIRLLEVDNRTVIPFSVDVRLITTSTDVIHAWTIPSLGVKVDSVPGRLNQQYFFSQRVGICYGQCSEICGSLHSFMPICLEVVSKPDFLKWISGKSL